MKFALQISTSALIHSLNPNSLIQMEHKNKKNKKNEIIGNRLETMHPNGRISLGRKGQC